MNETRRQDILQRFLMSVWAMVTFVLLFAVGLLIYEMSERGQAPLSTLGIPDEAAAPPKVTRPEAPLGTRNVTLYFASSDGRALQTEVVVLEYSGSAVENCRRALAALIAGPRDLLTRVVPPSTKVRAVYLLQDGELVIDFSRDLQTELGRVKSASTEALFIYGVVNTVTQSGLQTEHDPAVRRVRFLIEGAPPSERFPAHLDLSLPVGPDTRWVADAGELPSNV